MKLGSGEKKRLEPAEATKTMFLDSFVTFAENSVGKDSAGGCLCRLDYNRGSATPVIIAHPPGKYMEGQVGLLLNFLSQLRHL